jgi:hypothetical protein
VAKNKKSRGHRNLPTAFWVFGYVNPAGLRADSSSLFTPPPPEIEKFAVHKPFSYKYYFFYYGI